LLKGLEIGIGKTTLSADFLQCRAEPRAALGHQRRLKDGAYLRLDAAVVLRCADLHHAMRLVKEVAYCDNATKASSME
jgi:hypothetical protein